MVVILLLLTASATGFVTFKTRRAQVTAAQMPVLSQQYPKVNVYNLIRLLVLFFVIGIFG